MTLPKIYCHSLEGYHHLVEALHKYLPTCIPLYRRLQFRHYTSSSYILSSLSPDKLHQEDTCAERNPWLAAYVDRSRRPETEVWLFGTWEHLPSISDESTLLVQELLRALVAEIHEIGLEGVEASSPPSAAATNGQENTLAIKESKDSATKVGRAEYEGHLANPNIVLFGAVHGRTVDMMKQIGLLAEGFVGTDIPYRKYIFDLSSKASQGNALPSNLVWAKVQPSHFALVKSRTQIPRTDRTLIQLPSLAIFPKNGDAPIAWSFLGPDASLSSLHVEPEYRGRGLAKTLAARIFRDGMDTYWQGQPGRNARDGYAHADVAEDNSASNGVCKGLNGVWHFHVYWVRVDLTRAVRII